VSRILNEFIKGACWGFVAFVHFALVMVLVFRFTINCFPRQLVMRMLCLPGPGPAQCPEICQASDETFFYSLVVTTLITAVVLPLAFGLVWTVKSRGKAMFSADTRQNSRQPA
jgi:H+/gluconate symporter-like permease